MPQLFPDAYVMPFVPLCNPPPVERGVGRSWTMKSGTNQETVAATSWRWGLTHRKQSVRGFSLNHWSCWPEDTCRMFYTDQGFRGSRRRERRRPLNTKSFPLWPVLASVFLTDWDMEDTWWQLDNKVQKCNLITTDRCCHMVYPAFILLSISGWFLFLLILFFLDIS